MVDQTVGSLNITDEPKPKSKAQGTYLLWRIPILRLPDSDHPLFQLERKHIPWAKTTNQAKQHGWRYLLRFVLFLIGTWIGGVLLFGSIRNANVSYQPYQPYYSIGWELWAFAIPASLGLTILLDLVILGYTVNTISREHTLRRMDLLRIASSEAALLRAKYTLGRLRTWRPYLLMFGARLSVFIVFLLMLTVVEFLHNGRIGDGYIDAIRDYPFQTITATSVISLLILTYLIEPFWRTRAMVAIGVMISTYARRVSSAAIFSFFAGIIIWMSQVLIIWMLGYTFFSLEEFLSRMWYNITRSYDDSVIWLVLAITFMIMTFIIIYLYYRVVQRVALHRTLKRLF